MTTTQTAPVVIPIRRGANRIDDAMMAGHLRRTGHTLVAHRVIIAGIATVKRSCCQDRKPFLD